MTTIAWDGRYLASDKLANVGDVRRSVRKIIKTAKGELLFSGGNFDTITALFDWYIGDKGGDEFYKIQKENDWQPLNVICRDGAIYRYEKHPIPFRIEDRLVTAGSGSHFAMAFMSMGLSAAEAVARTIALDPYSGGGIDILSLDE